MIISLVVAAADNNAIGKNNHLLWNLPMDMKFFKNLTWAMPVVMGRKTFESMGSKPLKGRKNIIITRQQDWTNDGVDVVPGIKDAVDLAVKTDYKEIFIIGGGEIYKQTIGIADRIYITRVHATPEGDTFFPEINKSEWKLVKNISHSPDEKHAHSFSFQVWEKEKELIRDY